MKETITGLQEALDKRGMNIKLKPKSRNDALLKAGEIDGEIEELKDVNEKLYREERTKYYLRLKNCQAIGQLERARRLVLGFKDRKTHEQIDLDIKKGMGFKDDK